MSPVTFRSMSGVDATRRLSAGGGSGRQVVSGDKVGWMKKLGVQGGLGGVWLMLTRTLTVTLSKMERYWRTLNIMKACSGFCSNKPNLCFAHHT